MRRQTSKSGADARVCAFLLLVASLTVLTGCSSGGGPSSASPSPAASSPAAGALDGTSWRLKAWSVSSLAPADFTITAAFADGQISGKSGVNTYGGPYTTGPNGAFSVGSLASTMMAGPEPAMRAESAYAELLAQSVSYLVTNETLLLYDAGGNELLDFGAAGK